MGKAVIFTLILLPQAPTPNNDNTLDHEDNKDVLTDIAPTIPHISFATLQAEKQKQAPETATKPRDTKPMSLKPQIPPHKTSLTPVHFSPFVMAEIYSALR
ncbi:MAG: hypothetical protein RR475_03690 [Clostridia bacterium]